MSPPRSLFYILVDGQPVPVADAFAWAAGCATAGTDLIVQQTQIGAVTVSTVFLGIDQNYAADGPPLLYETRIFGDAWEGQPERYATREQARLGHERWVARVRASQGFPST